MEFKKFDLESRDKIIKYFAQKPGKMGTERNFTSYFIWQSANFEYAQGEDEIFVRSYCRGEYCYRMPYTEKGYFALKEYVKNQSYKFKLCVLDSEDLELLKKLDPENFEIKEIRNAADYIYSAEKLITLSGKKLHAKRNFLNRFLQNQFTYEKIDSENLEEAKNFTLDKVKDEKEHTAMTLLFDNFTELSLIGAIIRIEGKIVALSVGEWQNSETVIIHVEKANSDIAGAYPAINNLFVKNEFSNAKYINREEDMGIEGLRKAKLSYYPDILLMKYSATEK